MKTPQESEIIESLKCTMFLQYLLYCQTGIMTMKRSGGGGGGGGANNFDRPIRNGSSKLSIFLIRREII